MAVLLAAACLLGVAVAGCDHAGPRATDDKPTPDRVAALLRPVIQSDVDIPSCRVAPRGWGDYDCVFPTRHGCRALNVTLERGRIVETDHSGQVFGACVATAGRGAALLGARDTARRVAALARAGRLEGLAAQPYTARCARRARPDYGFAYQCAIHFPGHVQAYIVFVEVHGRTIREILPIP